MDYISSVTISNYGCIRDLTLELGPLHALIGPNASGKSTILRALRTLGAEANGQLRRNIEHLPSGRIVKWAPFNPCIGAGSTLEITCSAGGAFRIRNMGEQHELSTKFPDEREFAYLCFEYGGFRRTSDRKATAWGGYSWTQGGTILFGAPLLDLLVNGFRVVHPFAAAMREPGLIGTPLEESALEIGRGLAAVYDEILSRDVDGFMAIRERVRALFPSIRSIGLVQAGNGTKRFEATLQNGERIDADGLSEGLLYFLFFAALEYSGPVGMLLVEEPENGLHPSRIREVVNILKEVSKTTQVLIATHSPLVINELEPEQVSLITCPPDLGTVVTPISKTWNFKERSQIFALGELWLSYADGVLEEDLTQEDEPKEATGQEEEIYS